MTVKVSKFVGWCKCGMMLCERDHVLDENDIYVCPACCKGSAKDKLFAERPKPKEVKI